MPCYNISLWQVMSMMDGTERLKENYTHTHTATLLPICRQQLHDGGQAAGRGFYISSFVASSFAEESPQQGRIRFVGRVLRSIGDCRLLGCAELQGQLQGSVGQAQH